MTRETNMQKHHSRRDVLKGFGAAGAAAAVSSVMPGYAQAQSSEPIRIGFQVHRTGIGAAYGRWYERVTNAAVERINGMGGIMGRPVEIIAEDDGTDPKRGAEVVEKFATEHRCDLAFGTLFSHVVIGSAPRAGELKIPYLVVSEGNHVASGILNRYTLQPCITNVQSQVQAMAPFVHDNLGRKVTMLFADFAFGHDHRDAFSAAFEQQGGTILEKIAIPTTATSFSQYFPRIPRDTEILYHVVVGPAVLTFVKELGEFFGGQGPGLFGYIDSLEAVDINSPGLEFLEGSHLWEGMPRYTQSDSSILPYDAAYREMIGVDENGASVTDSRDVSTYAHMFGCWETLNLVKDAMEMADYTSDHAGRVRMIEAIEAMREIPASINHPQGDKIFNGKTHQVFGHQYITRVANGRLDVAHVTSIEDTFYPDQVDYTTLPF
ncbi:MAG: ABC transporter substrate-binding protein [Rhodobacteraceae bacterium]|nr:ABC transporter substrate-binding protein [Paracoccaceae bacterium]